MKNNLEKFIHILKEKKIKLCLAESISGGGLAYEMIKNNYVLNPIDVSPSLRLKDWKSIKIS